MDDLSNRFPSPGRRGVKLSCRTVKNLSFGAENLKPVCLVIGAGAGIGGTVAKRFAREGYHACLCRRSDQEGLDKLVAEIEDAGGSASGTLVNAVKDDTIEELVASIESDIGPIEVALYNLGCANWQSNDCRDAAQNLRSRLASRYVWSLSSGQRCHAAHG